MDLELKMTLVDESQTEKTILLDEFPTKNDSSEQIWNSKCPQWVKLDLETTLVGESGTKNSQSG